MSDNNNIKREDEDEFITPIARNLIDFVEESKALRKQTAVVIDKSIKLGSLMAVNEYESPIYRNALEDIKNQINKVPAPVTVTASTLIPYILAKPKFLKLRPFNLAVIGFSASMYYCCPQVVSLASKKAVELYNEFRENL